MFNDKNKKMQNLTLNNILFIISFTVLLIYIILNLQDVFSIIGFILSLCKPFIYGIMIAFVFHLPLKFYQAKIPASFTKHRSVAAALCALISILIVLSFILWIVIPTLIDSISSLISTLPSNIEQIENSLQNAVDQQNLPASTMKEIQNIINNLQTYIVELFKNGIPHFLSMASGFASSIANLFLGIVIAIYITVSKKRLQTQLQLFLYAFTPDRISKYILHIGSLANKTFSSFISGQLLEAIIIGVLCYAGCIILRFPYAPIIALIIGCTNIIPIFGAIFGVAISAILIAFVNPMQGLFFIIFGIILQQFESNIIYPRVVGSSVGLSGLWVLFAITLGGGLFGFFGMLLGLPTFSLIYQLLKEEMHRRIAKKKQT